MPNHRFPNFSKVVLAIFEAKIENIIGKEAISEVKAPYLLKELEIEMQKACERAEQRLISKYSENDIAQALSELNIFDLPTVKKILVDFYNNPTSSSLLNVFRREIAFILPTDYQEKEIISAAADYLGYVWEEMTIIPDIRNRLQAISMIRMEQNTEEIEKILASIDKKLENIAKTGKTPKILNNPASPKYTQEAASNHPALVLFLIDTGSHMKEMVGEIPAYKLITDALREALITMVQFSTKGSSVAPRYFIGCYAYNIEVIDVLGGILSIGHVAKSGLPQIEFRDKSSDSFAAFLFVEGILQNYLKDYENCPPPLVCHISAKEYPSRNPESVVNRIKAMSVTYGNVLVENILIDTESVLIPVAEPMLWSGVRNESELGKSYARQLFRMSSVMPETYRKNVFERFGYNLARNSRLLFPGTQPEMINLGLVVSAASYVPRRSQ